MLSSYSCSCLCFWIDSLPKSVRLAFKKLMRTRKLIKWIFFFFVRQMAPPESYNYHPIIPPPDAENPSPYDGETTCSICYEEVDLYPRSSALSHSTHVHGRSNSLDKKSSFSLSPTVISSKDKISREKESEREGLLGGLGGLDRRNYAIAPCGHVFHTSCLAQWMSIKVCSISLCLFSLFKISR